MGMVSKDILRNGDWRLCSMSPDGPDEAIRAAGNCHCVKGSEDPIPHTIRRQWPRGRPGAQTVLVLGHGWRWPRPAFIQHHAEEQAPVAQYSVN